MRILVVCTDATVPVPGHSTPSRDLVGLVGELRRAGHPTFLLGTTGHALPALDGPVMLVANPGEVEPAGREARDRETSDRALVRGSDVVTRFAPEVVYERLAPFGDAGARLAHRTGARHVVEVDRLLTPEEARRRGLPVSAIDHEVALLAEVDAIVTTDADLVARLGELSPGATVTVVSRDGGAADRISALAETVGDRILRAS